MDGPLEGCVKKWLMLIFEHLVREKWISWLALERLITSFPYKGKDANNKPILSSKKMKQKVSRKIVGTFSEISCLLRSLTQIMFDHIKNPQDEFWMWLLAIRKFLRFMLMPEITESQLNSMNETLENVMNTRMRLTRVTNINNSKSKKKKGCKKKVQKYNPPIIWKEHNLSHFMEDVRNLGPLVLLNTDMFEQKV